MSIGRGTILSTIYFPICNQTNSERFTICFFVSIMSLTIDFYQCILTVQNFREWLNYSVVQRLIIVWKIYVNLQCFLIIKHINLRIYSLLIIILHIKRSYLMIELSIYERSPTMIKHVINLSTCGCRCKYTIVHPRIHAEWFA